MTKPMVYLWVLWVRSREGGKCTRLVGAGGSKPFLTLYFGGSAGFAVKSRGGVLNEGVEEGGHPSSQVVR